MNDQAKKAESELNSARKLWWFFPLSTGVYTVLTYIFSGGMGSDTGTGGTVNMQWQLLLIFVSVAEVPLSIILSTQFPSKKRLERILLGHGTNRLSPTSIGRSRASTPQPTVFGTLMVGTTMVEGISVWGLLLAFQGIQGNSQTLLVLGYTLMLLGAIALVFHRWRSTRLVKSVLRELGPRTGMKEMRST